MEPLSKLHGRRIVPELLLSASDVLSKERGILHALGVHLSINEWIADYEKELKADEEVSHMNAISQSVELVDGDAVNDVIPEDAVENDMTVGKCAHNVLL